MSTTQTTPRRTRSAWQIVAKREILAQLQDKAFWIGTISTLVIIAIAFLASAWFNTSGSPTKVAVASDQAASVLAQAHASGTNVEAVRVSEDQVDATVRSGDADAALAFSDTGGWQLKVKSLTSVPSLDDAVRTVQIEANSVAQGVDAATILKDTTISVVPLDNDGSAIGVTVASFAFSILFMMAAITYGMQIAQSVVTEKESRIVEILAAAVPIRSLLVGKVVGNTLMALGQVVLIVSVALVGLSMTQYRSMIGLVGPVAGWFVLFFLVGFASLACLWAAAGSMATRVQDLGQTTTPLMMIVMMVYMAGMFATGTIAKVLAYVPVASTVVMPGRLLNGEATWLDALLALGASIAFMALTIWVGVRVYRRGLLQTGSVLSLKQALTRGA